MASADQRLVAAINAVEAAVLGAGGGSLPVGAASSANQLVEISRLEAIRDRLPASLSAGGKLLVDQDTDDAADALVAATGGLVRTFSVRPGDQSWSVVQQNAGNTNTLFEVQLADNTWSQVPMAPHYTSGAVVVGNASTILNIVSGAAYAVVAMGKLPPGAKAVRFTVQTLFSGTPSMQIFTSRKPYGMGPGSLAVGLIPISGLGDTTGTLSANAGGFLFNGGSWDRARANYGSTVLSNVARTATATIADTRTYNAGSLAMVVKVNTAGTGALTPTVEGRLTAGGYRTLLAGAAINGVGTYTYEVGRGLPDTPNLSANKGLPYTIRGIIAHSDASSWTYSVDFEWSV